MAIKPGFVLGLLWEVGEETRKEMGVELSLSQLPPFLCTNLLLPINCSGLSSQRLPPLPLDPALSPPVLLTHSRALEAPFCPPVLSAHRPHTTPPLHP